MVHLLRNEIAAVFTKYSPSNPAKVQQEPMPSDDSEVKSSRLLRLHHKAADVNVPSIQFVALVCRKNGLYSVSFPDFKNCIASASDLDGVMVKAAEVLALCIEDMIDNGEELPTFAADPAGVVVALVPYKPVSRPARVRITVDAWLLARIDQAAEATGESRSEYLANAARQRVEHQTGTDTISEGAAIGPVCSDVEEFNLNPVMPVDTTETLKSIKETLSRLDMPLRQGEC